MTAVENHSLNLTRPHLNTKVLKSYVAYIELRHPSVDLRALCKQAGLDYDYIQNEENWVSIVFAQRFTKLCIEATGEQNLSKKIGYETVSQIALGTTLYYFLRYALPTHILYEKIPKLAPMFNRLLDVKIIDRKNGSISLLYTIKQTDLKAEEKEALALHFKEIIDNTIGYFESIPTIQASPPATVAMETIETSAEGSPERIIFSIQYTSKKPIFRILYGALAVTALALALLGVVDNWFSALHALGIFAVASITSLVWAFFRIYHLKKGISANEKAVERINEQYIDLQQTKEGLKRKLDETQLFNKMLARLTSAVGEEEIIELSNESIREVLGYDRAIIFIKDGTSDTLRFAGASGMSDGIMSVLAQFKLKINIPSKDPKKVSNVFNNRQGFLVDDVIEHMPTLETDSQEILTFTGSRSFLAAPIATDNEKFGVLCVDYFEQRKQLSEDDLRLMTSVGNQIAVALEKEKAQRETIEALKESDRVKDEILATTSHELRTPLHGIIGLAESLRDGELVQGNQEAKSHLDMIMSSGRRLSDLVDTILDYSKLLHDDKKINYSLINLRALVERTFDLISSRADQKSIKLVNDIELGFPDIEADEEAIIRVLTNLIGNAIKFTEKGSVRAYAEELDKSVILHIEDSGRGIPRDQIQDIFQAFKQVDSSATRSFEGTGLGLTITKELVQLHGGQIQVESLEGQGSIFSFSLPKKASGTAARKMMSQKLEAAADSQLILNEIKKIDQEPLRQKPETSLTPLQTRAPVTDHKAVILTVDDDLINQQVLTSHLASAGYGIVKAETGPEAIEKINQGLQPDLILMDVMMPGMTGFEATRKIRESLPAAQCPIIFLTARKSEKDIVEGIQCGGNDYLAKPFYKNELLARIESHITLARTARAYARFVPWELLNLLKKESILDVQLGDRVESEMTILFADMRSFTSLSEEKSPLEAFQFLGDYLKKISPIVRENGGFIDKFIGDAIMAVFPGGPDDAIKASTDMVNKLEELRDQLKGTAKKKIGLAVGINHGPLVLGTLGNHEQMQGTVISDTVNTAARLEALAKRLSCKVLITEEAFAQVKNKNLIAHRYLGRLDVKGKQQSVGAVEIFESDQAGIRQLKESSREELTKLLMSENTVRASSKTDLEWKSLIQKFGDDPTLSELSNLIQQSQK